MSTLRFAKISSLPSEYGESFYRRDPQLASMSYETQYRTIMDDCFAFADFWKTGLEKTGKFDVQEILLTVEPLQKKWAKENNISFSEETWSSDIARAQISLFRPDIVFVHGPLKPGAVQQIRSENTSIRLVLGWDGAFRNNPELFEGCDIILSDDPINADFYAQHGYQSYHFSFGFEQSILERITMRKKRYDLSFVGSLQMRKDFHARRLQFLSAISKRTSIDTWIPYFPALLGPLQKEWVVQVREMRPRYYMDAFHIFNTNHGGAFGLHMYQTLADSKITLNMHGDQYERAGNMRLWEATGAGTCLLTDYKSNINDYFEPGKEILTYTSTEDALEKIRYLLDHEEERKKIAAAGQKRTLEQYTYTQRMAVFGEFVVAELARI